MLQHRGFHDDNCPTVPTALSLAPSRAPLWARARALSRGEKPAPRADTPPGASGQRD